MEEARLIALVNLLVDSIYPNPDGPDPVGPWGPWIREALKDGPVPEPWQLGPLPDPWQVAFGTLAGLAGHFDNDLNQWGGWHRPRPNWVTRAIMHDIAFLNPQPLPPVDGGGIAFARTLANVALGRASEAGSEKGSHLLKRFSEDWCGTMILIPKRPKLGSPGEPRPPRPEESLVLGATLVRASESVQDDMVKRASQETGNGIFRYGLSSLA